MLSEKFTALDLKSGTTKDNKKFYYLVCYSSSEYLFRVFLDETHYNALRNSDLTKFDVANKVSKRYDDKNKTFRYFLDK